jgi:hypothetical protein
VIGLPANLVIGDIKEKSDEQAPYCPRVVGCDLRAAMGKRFRAGRRRFGAGNSGER